MKVLSSYLHGCVAQGQRPAVELRRVGATLAPYGGRFLVRGTPAVHLEGDPARSRNAVIHFDSLTQAQAWYTSPAYQKLIPIRQKLTKTNSYLVEGVTP